MVSSTVVNFNDITHNNIGSEIRDTFIKMYIETFDVNAAMANTVLTYRYILGDLANTTVLLYCNKRWVEDVVEMLSALGYEK